MSQVEKHSFQAEIQQLLNIVIHSLYTDKEIFIRELISNSADALEKLRFHQSSGASITEPDRPLNISIRSDEKQKTITITDTGLGMTHAELIENLGMIAHSGSKAFLKQLAEEKKREANLIGQFGVGFYSAFMVASKVTVHSRSFRPEETGWTWSSEGSGGYEIEPAKDLPRGTQVVLQLKEENQDFAQGGTIERIIKRYSNFVSFPIELNGSAINTVRAIWSRNKNEIKEEEYNEFYHFIGHDSESPLFRLHFTADAPLAIQALLFVPSRNFETPGLIRTESQVNLYCRKVLIQAHAKGLFPEWLRFLRGVVDSEDLPLNISRETMQDTALMQKLNRVLTGKFTKFLEEQAEKSPEAYDKFFQEFGRFLKEGVVNDFTHRDSIAKLLRFESSVTEAGKRISLEDYVKRMPSEQKEIYYLLAPNREAAQSSPYFEVFAARKYEVLFLSDPWDEFVMEHLHEFERKTLRSAEKADLEVDEPQKSELSNDESRKLANWVKETLGDRVGEVRSSKRLVGSPALVVDSDPMMTGSMRRMMKAINPEAPTPESKPDLEINPAHGIIVRLNSMRETDTALAAKVAEQLLDNAKVAAGLLEDPRSMLTRLNEILERVLAPKSG